jgi:tetratricopeptide (TPR) repeat protein
MTKSEKYFKDSFFEELTKTTEKTNIGHEVVKNVETLFGHSISESTRAVLQFLQDYKSGAGFGDYFTTDLALPENQTNNTFKWLLSHGKIEVLAQAFTNSVMIGADSGGQQYYINLDLKYPEVFLHNSGVLDMKFLADSPESFAYLNLIYQDFMLFAHDHQIAIESIIDGELPDSPEISFFQEELKLLSGKINLANDSDVYSNYQEICNGLNGTELIATSSTNAMDAYDNAFWIMRLLTNNFETPPADIRSIPETNTESLENGAELLYWLWHYYFIGEDNALNNLCNRCKNHPAKIVRDTVSVVDILLKKPNELTELNYLRLQRDLLVNGNVPPIFEKEIDAAFLKPHKQDDYTISSTKKMLLKNLDDYRAWDQLAYAYNTLKVCEKAQIAAEKSLAFNPNSYYAWLQHGIALHEQKHYEGALASYDRALCFNGHPNLWTNKILALLESDKFSEATGHLVHQRIKVDTANEFVSNYQESSIKLEEVETLLVKLLANHNA